MKLKLHYRGKSFIQKYHPNWPHCTSISPPLNDRITQRVFRVIYHYGLHFPRHNVTALVRLFYSPNKKPSHFAAPVQCFLGVTALLNSTSRRTLPTRSNKPSRAAAASDCASIRASRWGSLSLGLRPGCQISSSIYFHLFGPECLSIILFSPPLTAQSPSSEDESVVLAKATFSPKVVTHKMIKQPRVFFAS